jgi:thymidine phosphorylase
MLPQELIRKKRDRQVLTAADINEFIAGVTAKSVSESQVSAFCMAVLLNGMTREERVSLTMAMAGSGITLDWSDMDLNGPVLDKHSTGGVGDKVSLMLAPIAAACGAYVPMLSGRGLGHTGGTLDKMDSIPGYVSQPSLDKFRKVVKETGSAIIGATSEMAPADRIIYAVRDVTGTVESLDLITASILSKKLAAGLHGLVMDVKFGSGAFMPAYGKAKELAESIAGVAHGAGVNCTAIMTDMNEVLGRTAGNAIEVREAVEFLRGEAIDPRLYEVTMALTGEMLALGGIARDEKGGRALAEQKLRDGSAAEFFARSVHALGGPSDIITDFAKHLPLAPIRHEVRADRSGHVESVDTRQIGVAVIELGGGRRQTSDKIDHSVGLAAVAGIGEIAGPGEQPLAVIFGRDDAKIRLADEMIRNAFRIGDQPPAQAAPVIAETIHGERLT